MFTAIAGSSAALTGLLFVALSINLSHVIKGPGLIGRAVEVLVLLTSVLIISTLLLMPGQTTVAAATEVIGVGALDAFVIGVIHVRAPRRALRAMGVSSSNFALRVMGAQSGPAFLLIGGISMLLGNGGGLYWVAPACIAAMVAAIVGAWVMLVEIVR